VFGAAEAPISCGAMDGHTTRVQVRVSPGASRSAVIGRHGDAWKVRVVAAPERGKANKAVLDLLAETLGLPRAQVELVSGAGARDKVIALRGLEADQADLLLAAASEDAS
jgi:uncharacterized protein (TIGR00251 family)